MGKYFDAEKLIAEIERWRDKAKEKYNESTYTMGRCDALAEFRNHIVSLLEEQPDNEDIDKVAQELYKHLYELKRRSNVPTNLYDKQEIIDLWKAGVEYGRNHPKQDHFADADKMEKVDLEKEVINYLKTHQLHIKDGGRVVFDNDDSPNFMCDIRDIARHFAEWGAIHLNARKEEEYDRQEMPEMREPVLPNRRLLCDWLHI